MVHLTNTQQRINAVLTELGVNPNTVLLDGIRLEPWGTGFMLRWDGMAVLTADQATAIVNPTPIL